MYDARNYADTVVKTLPAGKTVTLDRHSLTLYIMAAFADGQTHEVRRSITEMQEQLESLTRASVVITDAAGRSVR